jgi:5-methylcytosine-specific restriction endonuclease McrA
MLAELITLLLSPITLLLRRRRATPEEIRRFYRSAEWKRARYEALCRSPACVACGRSAADGAKMNVDHIKPLSQRWDLRFVQSNLQTMCAACNWGKGGTEKDWRKRR